MRYKRALLTTCCTALLTAVSCAAFASGFQSFEQNASGLGNAYAGAGSLANDASIEFDNPAGMVRIKRPTVSASVIALNAHAHFVATSNKTLGGQEVLGTARKNGQNPLGLNFLPAIHVVMPFNDRLFFGYGVTVPFGLETDYDSDSTARYFAKESKIETINVGMSLGYKVTDKFSVGAGVDAQYLTTVLSQQVDGNAILVGPTNPSKDLAIKNKANDWGNGWHAGIMYQFTPNTRVGLSYRSHVKHKPSGDVRMSYGSGLDLTDIILLKSMGYRDGRVSSSITIPDYAVLSLYHAFNPKWAMMGSVTYTHWSLFKELKLHLDTGVTPPLPDAVVHEGFRDTWKYAMGLDYTINPKWLWRFGVAYDQSPVNNRTRTVPLPDGHRWWVSTGARYQFTERGSVDIGYTHVFIANGTFHQEGPQFSSIVGHFHNNYADLLGIQLNWML